MEFRVSFTDALYIDAYQPACVTCLKSHISNFLDNSDPQFFWVLIISSSF